jgi:hypothetical protein
MDSLRQDLRYSVRRLFKNPGFTVIAVLTLALGIGANSAIFSVVSAVLLKPLPYPESGRLVGVFQVWKGRRTVMSPPNFLDVQRQSRTVPVMAALSQDDYTLTGVGEPVRIEGAEVSATFFDVLRTRPLIGRTFAADENEPGKHRVVMLGHSFWQQRFGAQPDVVAARSRSMATRTLSLA